MWNHADNDNNSAVPGFLMGALAGAIVGAGVALLFAPKTGKKMREDLLNQYSKASERISQLASSAVERVSELAETASAAAMDAADSGRDMMDRGKKEVNKAATQVSNFTAAR
jgi:gas vesicle protein